MHRSGKWVGTVPGSERLWGRCALLGARLQSGPKRLFSGTLGSDVVSFSIPSLLLCVKDVVLRGSPLSMDPVGLCMSALGHSSFHQRFIRFFFAFPSSQSLFITFEYSSSDSYW